MGGLKAKLTHKLGPLPVYAWALLIIAAFLAYRRFHSASDSTATTDATAADSGIIGTGVGSGGTPAEYHEPIPISPGDGIYDPNTGKFIVNPPPSILPDTPDANTEPTTGTPPTSDATPAPPAAQTVAVPHPQSSPVVPRVIGDLLTRIGISNAVRANVSPQSLPPIAHIVATVKPVSPAVIAASPPLTAVLTHVAIASAAPAPPSIGTGWTLPPKPPPIFLTK